MKVQLGLLGWALFSGASFVAACGGSSDDGGGDAGGSSGKAGSASAGSSGSAGTASQGGSTSNGGASSAGTAAGGRNTGGRNSTGGMPGSGGFNLGGEGFDPSDFTCESPPEVGAACGAEAMPCLNGTDVCYCDASKWACMSVLGGGGGAGGTGAIGDIDCPATKPTTGVACGNSVGFCPYGEGAFSGCACYQGSWACL